MKYQIKFADVLNLYDAYIKVFDDQASFMGTALLGLKLELDETCQKYVAHGQISHKQLMEQVRQQIQMTIQNQNWRLVKTLRVLYGDIDTLAANQVVCLGIANQEHFLMVKKEPILDRDETCYDYAIVEIPITDDNTTITNQINFKMTNQNLNDLTNQHSLFEDMFQSIPQQVAVINASTISIAKFNQWNPI